MAKRSTKDLNELAASILNQATRVAEETLKTLAKDPAAVTLGRKGGLKGGKARAASLSPARRAQIAKKAAAARWKGKR